MQTTLSLLQIPSPILVFASNESHWTIKINDYLAYAKVVLKDKHTSSYVVQSDFHYRDINNWNNICLHITSPSMIEISDKPEVGEIYYNTYAANNNTYVNLWILFYNSWKLATLEIRDKVLMRVWFSITPTSGYWVDANKCKYSDAGNLKIFVSKSHTLFSDVNKILINRSTKFIYSRDMVEVPVNLVDITDLSIKNFKGKWGLDCVNKTPHYEQYYTSVPPPTEIVVNISVVILVLLLVALTLCGSILKIRHQRFLMSASAGLRNYQ